MARANNMEKDSNLVLKAIKGRELISTTRHLRNKAHTLSIEGLAWVYESTRCMESYKDNKGTRSMIIDMRHRNSRITTLTLF